MNYAKEKERIQEKNEYRKRYRGPLLSRLYDIHVLVYPIISRLKREILRIKRLIIREKLKLKNLKQRYDRFDERKFLEIKQSDKKKLYIRYNKKKRDQKNQNVVIKKYKDNRKKFSCKYG